MGQTVFSGPQSESLEYFKELGYAVKPFCNPADYFIELISTDFEGSADVQHLVDAFSKSSNLAQISEAIDGDTALGGVDASASGNLTPSFGKQLFALISRNHYNNVRNPGLWMVRIVLYTILSLVVGLLYLKSASRDLEIDPLAITPMLFYVQAFYVFISVAVLPFFIDELQVFGRERANGSLNVGSYVIANFVTALPAIALISLISSLLIVELAGLNSFGWFFLNMFLSLVVAESLMHVIGAIVPHYIIGITLAAGIYGLFILCEGVMVPRNAIPGYWKWVYYIAFHTYSFRSFMFAEFGHASDFATILVLKKYDVSDVNISNDMVVLACYAVILQIIYAIILFLFHTGKRR
jgi:hypothetical protein